MAVRSLALLQLVKRTPFKRRHTFGDSEEEIRRRRQSFYASGARIRGSDDESTSAACHRISTFLFFLVFTFWLSSLSSSGTLVVLRERGRPEEMTVDEWWAKNKKKGGKYTFLTNKLCLSLTVFWKDLFKLVVVRAEASHAFHVDDILQRCVSEPAHTHDLRVKSFL